jgi:hypothetical protein
MRRALFLAVALCPLLFAGGCLMPYAYPKLDYTPPVKLDTPPGEVHAFRVDLTRYISMWMPMEEDDRMVFERLTEIPVPPTVEVPAQIKLSVTSGSDLNFEKPPEKTEHSVALRLYRPGYELVEIGAWEQVDRVCWKPAPDLKAQTKALDQLTSASLSEGSSAFFEQKYGLDQILPKSATVPEIGSVSPEHRAALLFAAAEYEKLATGASSPDEQKELKAKATELRKLADAPPMTRRLIA